MITYLRGDMDDENETHRKTMSQGHYFNKELKFWGLNDMYLRLDQDLINMLESEPQLNPNWSQKPLETWKKLKPLDLNQVHEINPIDTSQDLVFKKEEH